MGMGLGFPCCERCKFWSNWAPLIHPGVRIELHCIELHLNFWAQIMTGASTDCDPEFSNLLWSDIQKFILFYSAEDEVTDSYVFERFPSSTSLNPEIAVTMRVSRSVFAPIGGLGGPAIGPSGQPLRPKRHAIESIDIVSPDGEFHFERDIDAEFPFVPPGAFSNVSGSKLTKSTEGCRCAAGAPEWNAIHVDTYLAPRAFDFGLDYELTLDIQSSYDGPFFRHECSAFPFNRSFGNEPGPWFDLPTYTLVDGWIIEWRYETEVHSVPWPAPPWMGARFVFMACGTRSIEVSDEADPVLARVSNSIGVQEFVFGESIEHYGMTGQLLASAVQGMSPLGATWDNDWGIITDCTSASIEVTQ